MKAVNEQCGLEVHKETFSLLPVETDLLLVLFCYHLMDISFFLKEKIVNEFSLHLRSKTKTFAIAVAHRNEIFFSLVQPWLFCQWALMAKRYLIVVPSKFEGLRAEAA